MLVWVVLVVAIDTVTTWYPVSAAPPGLYFAVKRGVAIIGLYDESHVSRVKDPPYAPSQHEHFLRTLEPPARRWWFGQSGLDVGHAIWVPLWVIAGLPLVQVGIPWLLTLPGRDPNRCRRCRYDLKGLHVDSACPECGRTRPGKPLH